MLDRHGWPRRRSLSALSTSGEHGAASRAAGPRRSRWPAASSLLVGRDLGEPERVPRVMGSALMLALGMLMLGLGAGHLVLRRPPRAEAHRRRLRASQRDHGGRPVAAAAGDRRRRRVRPAGRNLNAMLARIERADERPEAGLRQHRPRPEDAADPAAQPRRGGARAARDAGRISRRRWRRRSRNPTS